MPKGLTTGSYDLWTSPPSRQSKREISAKREKYVSTTFYTTFLTVMPKGLTMGPRTSGHHRHIGSKKEKCVLTTFSTAFVTVMSCQRA
jgi:hypothetical protein